MNCAVLFLRLFAGGTMLLHNIGKLQSYDEIVGFYPALPLLGQGGVFVVVAVAETLLAVLVMAGIRVRAASLVMAVGLAAAFLLRGPVAGRADFYQLGFYVFFLAIAGGGFYAFDAARRRT